jgi:hypothetical protein
MSFVQSSESGGTLPPREWVLVGPGAGTERFEAGCTAGRAGEAGGRKRSSCTPQRATAVRIQRVALDLLIKLAQHVPVLWVLEDARTAASGDHPAYLE